MNIRKITAVLVAATLMLVLLPADAQAAPKKMKNGTMFDAEFYAETYPDVAAAVGTKASALYKHYTTFGIKEGRKPTADAAPAQAAAPAVPGSTAAPVVAPKQFVKRFKGKKVSIVGDSISTFGGCLPQDYVPYYPTDDMPTSDLTWWMQLIRAGGMTYVANASWSGSRVTGNVNEESGNPGCSIKRARDLFGKDKAPDVIFIMMGTNDFLSSVGPDNFAQAYRTMIANMKAVHPGAQIVCLTCIPVISSSGTVMLNALDLTIEDYNAKIRQIASETGVLLCNTCACGISADNYGSYMPGGVHPNAQWMALIASYIVNHL